MSPKVDHEVTVTLVPSGPLDGEGTLEPWHRVTLADVEAFAAECRRWGAPDGLLIPPGNLRAVIKLPDDYGSQKRAG